MNPVSEVVLSLPLLSHIHNLEATVFYLDEMRAATANKPSH